MKVSVNFIERREGDSPSIERVFRSVAANISEEVSTRFTKAKFGNSFLATLGNLAFFRPGKADIYHITGHISFMALVLPRDRTVLTIHDLTILNFRTGIRRWLIKWLYFVLPVRRSRFVTTISEATKEKLVRTAGIASNRVTVIENPLLVSKSGDRIFNSERPTILQIGTTPNKNLETLIEAVRGIPCKLRIIGSITEPQQTLLGKCEIDWSNETRLDDAGVEDVYENADILSLCSTEEGFGLPIIEAQAKGTVVVTSDRPPMNDVAGSGATLIDPEIVDSIRAGILDIIGNSELRERLIREGKKNIERFDPKEIAANYVAVYERVLETRNHI